MSSIAATHEIPELSKCDSTATNNGFDPFLRQVDVRFSTSSGDEIVVDATPAGEQTWTSSDGKAGKHPSRKLLSCIVTERSKFQDTSPSGSQLGTVVAIHGAPGSHKDYKYVTPLLHDKGIRFIGVNMPGFGITPGDPRLRCDNKERDNFVHELIAKIGNVERLVVMGHSRGCENATAVAARNVRTHSASGTALIPPVSAAIEDAAFLVYNNIIGLRLDSGERAMMCVRTMSHLELAKGVQPNIDRINQSHDTRVLVAYSGKDFLIETSISRELANAFKDHKELVSESRCGCLVTDV
ncbi:hypothetical protein COOONC_22386 [Cooperia oncophora]